MSDGSAPVPTCNQLLLASMPCPQPSYIVVNSLHPVCLLCAKCITLTTTF
jgi:hypothetical protein